MEGCHRSKMRVSDTYDNNTILMPQGLGYCSLRMNREMNVDSNYFEIEILVLDNITGVSLGVTPSLYPLDSIIGFGEGSIGYCAEDGGVYKNEFVGQKVVQGPRLEPPLLKGDVLGCGINFNTVEDGYVEVWFTIKTTRNHHEKGIIIWPQKVFENSGFYPMIAITCSGKYGSVAAVKYLGHCKADTPDLSKLSILRLNILKCSQTGHCSNQWQTSSTSCIILTFFTYSSLPPLLATFPSQSAWNGAVPPLNLTSIILALLLLMVVQLDSIPSSAIYYHTQLRLLLQFLCQHIYSQPFLMQYFSISLQSLDHEGP